MRSRQVRRARNIGLLVVTVLAIAVGVAGYAAHLLRSFELGTVDTRFSIRGKQPRPEDIVVVGIDDTTFNQLGKQWPFPRHLHGLLIERLTEAGAKAIGYDVQFTEPTDAPRGQRPRRGGRTRRQRRALDHRSQRTRRKQRLRRRRSRQADRRPGGQHHGPGRSGRSPAPLPGRLRRPGQLPGRARRSGHRQDGRSRRRRRPVPMDRLPRPARDVPVLLLLQGPARRSARRRLSRQGGDRRRHGAVAAGLRLDPGRRRPRNGGRRNARQRDLDGRERLPAAVGPRFPQHRPDRALRPASPPPPSCGCGRCRGSRSRSGSACSSSSPFRSPSTTAGSSRSPTRSRRWSSPRSGRSRSRR